MMVETGKVQTGFSLGFAGKAFGPAVMMAVSDVLLTVPLPVSPARCAFDNLFACSSETSPPPQQTAPIPSPFLSSTPHDHNCERSDAFIQT